MVTLGTWMVQTPTGLVPGGTVEQQEGTFMHEFGHTLGLGHGGEVAPRTGTLNGGADAMKITGIANTADITIGMDVSAADLPFGAVVTDIHDHDILISKPAGKSGVVERLFFEDNVNYKPNYHSIMNYVWQTPYNKKTRDAAFTSGWRLNYSISVFHDLDETQLDETKGIGGDPSHDVGIDFNADKDAYFRFVPEGGRADYNGLNGSNDTKLPLDLNNDRDASGQPILSTLKSYQDWPNIVYSFQDTHDASDGVHATGDVDELTREMVDDSDVVFYQAPQGNGADSVTLRRNGANLELVDDATHNVVDSVDVNVARLVRVIGADGEDDKLTVDFSGGNPFPRDGVNFFGGTGAGTNTLAFAGTLPTSPVFTQDGTPANGTLDFNGSKIVFSDLQFVKGVTPKVTTVHVSAASINENDQVTLNGDFLDAGLLASHTIAVNWGDGVTDSPVALTVGARTFSVSHRYLDDNPTNTASDTNTITVTITDDDSLTGTGTTSTTVNNIKPVLTTLTINVSSGDNIKEGDPIKISGTFTDVGTRDTHTVTINWDDGINTVATLTESNGSGSFTATHAITSGGIYTATATLRDDDTGSASASKTLFVTGVGVHQVGPYKSLQVVGTNGNDVVTIDTQGKTNFSVKAGFLAKKERIVPTAGITLIQVVLRNGNDTAKVYPSILVPAVIDGGAGDDKIDGDNASNVLIGGAGKDTLVGGTARNILIGGLGADALTGSGGDDILIGGTTSYDSGIDDNKLANDLALLKMLQEWNSTRTAAERVLNLTNGTGAILSGSGLSLKSGTTVQNDRDKDTLIGAAGTDWFFYDGYDLITDPKTDKKFSN